MPFGCNAVVFWELALFFFFNNYYSIMAWLDEVGSRQRSLFAEAYQG